MRCDTLPLVQHFDHGTGQGKGKVATAPEKGSEAMEVEPTNKAPDNTGSHGSFSQASAMQKNAYHVTTRKRFKLGA